MWPRPACSVNSSDICDHVAVRRLTVPPDTASGAWLEEAAAAVAAGLVVAFPTDTLYGLAADPRSTVAMARLFDLKGRAGAHVVALAASDLAQVRQVVEVDGVAERLAAAFWPGPLTLVLRPLGTLAPAVLGGTGGVGIRVPDHPVARGLARLFGCPVTATSANRTGEPASTSPDDVAHALPGLDVLVDAGPSAGGPPSTVVDLSGDAPVLVREGAVAWERVLEFLVSASDSSSPPFPPDGTRIQHDS
jgi:L-threonylcarbamoyladenylate synthase